MKIYPFKTVDADAVVNSSIIWETRGARTLFGRQGIRGLANVDVTPEVAVRVAMAYGTALKRGAVVTASRDTSRVARALKRALIAGLNFAGVTVEDVELATVPLTRFQVRNSHAQGGITVRLVGGDPDSVELRIFDADGRDLDAGTQRRIERLLYREDYRRAFGGDVGEIIYPPRAIEFYTAALERSVDAQRLSDRPAKVVLDYSFGAASVILPTVLGKLGAEVLAVNPYASTAAVTATEPDVQRARMGELVRASASQLGYIVEPAGETATIVDDTGHALSDDETLLLLLRLLGETKPGARVALPVSTTQAAARVLADAGGDGRVDQARRRRGDGDRVGGRHRLRGVEQRRLHLAGVPPRLRRHGHPGAAPRPARRDRLARVGRRRRPPARARRARHRAHRVGAQGGRHARAHRASPARRPHADRRGQGVRARRVDARAA